MKKNHECIRLRSSSHGIFSVHYGLIKWFVVGCCVAVLVASTILSMMIHLGITTFSPFEEGEAGGGLSCRTYWIGLDLSWIDRSRSDMQLQLEFWCACALCWNSNNNNLALHCGSCICPGWQTKPTFHEEESCLCDCFFCFALV